MSTPGTSRSHRIRPWTLVLAVLAALALVLGACSDDGDTSDDTSSGSEESDSDDSGGSSTDPETEGDTGTEGDFDSALAQANTLLDDSDDPCEIINGISQISGTPDPTSPEQTEAFVDYYTRFFTKLADGVDDSDAADTLRNAATTIEDYAAEVDYDIDALSNNEDSPLLAISDDVQTALNSLVAQCGPDTITGADPEGGAP